MRFITKLIGPMLLALTISTAANSTVTEQSHPATTELSQTTLTNTLAGLKLMHKIDDQVELVINDFVMNKYEPWVKDLKGHLGHQGRVILVGSGSSGRQAVSLSAYMKEKHRLKTEGIIAGELVAMVSAKENFEDDTEAGYKALDKWNIQSDDVVILISASGSAAFNLGAARLALEKGAHAYALTNVSEPNPAWHDLNEKGFSIIKLISPPQAISGSTRLQAASINWIALSMTLQALDATYDEYDPIAEQRSIRDNGQKYLKDLRVIHKSTEWLLPNLVPVIEAQSLALKKNRTITYLSSHSLREIFIDIAELSPTFGLPKLCNKLQDQRSCSPIRVLDLLDQSNLGTWHELCQCDLTLDANREVLRYQLNANDVLYYLDQQANKKDNLWVDLSFSQKRIKPETYAWLKAVHDHPSNYIRLDIPELAVTPLMESLQVKEILNLISNSVMIKTGHVYGNLMVDMNLSNKKLIRRAVGIITHILKRLPPHNGSDTITEQRIESQLQAINSYASRQTDRLPSVVRIAIVCLYQSISIEEAVMKLNEKPHTPLENILFEK